MALKRAKILSFFDTEIQKYDFWISGLILSEILVQHIFVYLLFSEPKVTPQTTPIYGVDFKVDF